MQADEGRSALQHGSVLARVRIGFGFCFPSPACFHSVCASADRCAGVRSGNRRHHHRGWQIHEGEEPQHQGMITAVSLPHMTSSNYFWLPACMKCGLNCFHNFVLCMTQQCTARIWLHSGMHRRECSAGSVYA